MRNPTALATLVAFTLTALAACSTVRPKNEVPFIQNVATPDDPEEASMSEPETAESTRPIWDTATFLSERCNAALAEAAGLKTALLSPIEGPKTANNTLVTFNALYAVLDDVEGWASLMFNTHPDEAVQRAAAECRQSLSKFATEVSLDPKLYAMAAGVDVSQADPLTKRFHEKLVRDFRRSGVDKGPASRERIKAINEELVELSQTFGQNVRGDVKSMQVDPKRLKGLPEDFVNAHPVGADGKVTLTTDYPDFFPIQKYAEDASLRKELYGLFMRRAYPANEGVLARILALRHELANIMGHPNWASYNAEDKMVKSAKTIEGFIQDLDRVVAPAAKKELKALLKYKRKDIRKAKRVEVWDRFYYVGQVREEQYSFDAQSVRPYFPYTQVAKGIFDLYGELFNVRFKKLEDAPVWHPSVEAYGMYEVEGDSLIGQFYLDMHPRDGKYKHAAMFPLRTGLANGRMPMGALVCNFPDPSEGDGSALMEHSQVQTYFHEFGHLIHQLLAQRGTWVTLAGINVEWDFVEAPSQILEEWAWDPDVLARFAAHHETGEVIPAGLVKAMREAEEFGKGLHVGRQLFYTAFSYFLHAQDPATVKLDAFTDTMYKRYSPYPRMKDDYVFANFGHIVGYSSMYYTYQWSLAIAKDMFTRFQASGMLDKDTAMDYRRTILEPGGTEDAAELVKDFLGRRSNLKAYKTWLSQ